MSTKTTRFKIKVRDLQILDRIYCASLMRRVIEIFPQETDKVEVLVSNPGFSLDAKANHIRCVLSVDRTIYVERDEWGGEIIGIGSTSQDVQGLESAGSLIDGIGYAHADAVGAACGVVRV